MALISYDKPDRKKARYATSAGLAPVAQYPPNEFDLHDMAGSVTEWCSDWFERTCYESSPQATPKAHQRAFTEWCATALGRTEPHHRFFRNWARPTNGHPILVSAVCETSSDPLVPTIANRDGRGHASARDAMR